MKSYIDFSLKGRDWWGAFLGFWVLYWIFYSPVLILGRYPEFQRSHIGLNLLLVGVSVVGLAVISAIFGIVFLRIIAPKVSVGGDAFAFSGSIGRYVWITLSGVLLTIVTLTIYLPWFERRILRYLASQTSFRGAAPEFLGRAGRLLKYLLLAMWVPVIVVAAIAGVIVGVSAAGNPSAVDVMGTTRTITTVITFAMFIVLIPFVYLLYKWIVSFRWKDVTITWSTRFWPSCGLILGQLLLSIITLSIYWPAALMRLYRYFTARTVFAVTSPAGSGSPAGPAGAAGTPAAPGSAAGPGATTPAGAAGAPSGAVTAREIGRLGFDGKLGKGFGLLWGQTLLSIITLGIYLPWAYARIGAWLLGATYYEESSTMSGERPAGS